MAIYKDGTIYRTLDEQVTHLTEVHREQLNINKNVQKTLQDLSVSANYGGYNYVRFAFQKRASKHYYRFKTSIPIPESIADIGDFIEVAIPNVQNIPAYGFVNSDRKLEMTDKSTGDFVAVSNRPIAINTKTGKTLALNVDTFEVFEEFTGTSLLDYDANNCQKQVFTVMDDVSLNSQTQYVSFDLNGDNVFNFVLVSVISVGRNGTSTICGRIGKIDEIILGLSPNDSCIRMDNYSVVVKNEDGTTSIIGNVRGEQGERGYQGERGEQGIQGVQGVQGIKGDKGDKGDSGTSPIRIFSGILNNAEELPDFSSAAEGDAYRIINTSGTLVTYDLYFKAHNGTNWDIQPNWGGVKGEQGERGEQGIQGVQGIQGEKGEKGDSGTYKPYTHMISFGTASNNHFNMCFESGESKLYTFADFKEIIKENLDKRGGHLNTEQITALFMKITIKDPTNHKNIRYITNASISTIQSTGEERIRFDVIYFIDGAWGYEYLIIRPTSNWQDSVSFAI